MKKITDERIKELLKKQRMSTWTDEEIKEIKRLVDSGLGYTIIYSEKIFPDKSHGSIRYMVSKVKGEK
jgi:hypothetical protein